MKSTFNLAFWLWRWPGEEFALWIRKSLRGVPSFPNFVLNFEVAHCYWQIHPHSLTWSPLMSPRCWKLDAGLSEEDGVVFPSFCHLLSGFSFLCSWLFCILLLQQFVCLCIHLFSHHSSYKQLRMYGIAKEFKKEVISLIVVPFFLLHFHLFKSI